MKITCCMDCAERHPGCHDHCEEYAAQRTEMELAKAVRAEAIREVNIAVESILRYKKAKRPQEKERER